MKQNVLRIAGAMVMLGMTAAAWAGEGTIRRSPRAIQGEYIVVLRDDAPREQVPEIARRLGQQYRGDVVRVWRDALKGFFVRMSAAQAEGLSHHPDVKYIEENAEMFLSATVPTNVDPACDPSPGNPCTTTDNRLWHLDVVDQNSAVGTNDYSYCETGSGVYVYVIDTGVTRAHREFNDDANRVLDGYDATGDPAWFPAYDPCRGFAPLTQGPDGQMNPANVRGGSSHGTGVASLVAGQNLGVARGAKIVPIKVAPCGKDGARKLNSNTPNTYYSLGEIVYANGTYYKVVQAGYTGAAGTYPSTGWPWPPGPSCCQQWGNVRLEYVGALPSTMSVQMTIDGLNWILKPASEGGNPNPKSPAVVTLSTYRLLHETGVTSGSPSLEQVIGNLLTYNNGHGITVIASANNQDSNACDTTPGRMSRNNPNNPNNAAQPYKVITVGGTMVRNNPDSNPATGGPQVNAAEPLYDATKQTILARWRCHAGDSGNCATNIYNPAPTPSATDPAQRIAYVGWNLGSNGGACVTLFAPAKNIPVATLTSSASYRDSRTTGGNASGTSWSAPMVAGMAARILQNNTAQTADQVYNALMARTAPDLDSTELNPPGVTGTPNALLRMTPITVQPLATVTPLGSNGSATITVTVSGDSGLTYQLYQVNSSFDIAAYNKGAASSTPIGSPQSSNSFSVAPASATSYFVRVRSNCGSADTNITTVTTISAPTGLVATASGSTVTISWNAVSNAGGYKVERKFGSGSWETAQTVSSGTTTSVTDTPSVPSGVVLYRVRATQGSAQSDPSGNDVAYTLGFTDDPVLTIAPYTKVKAVHIIEVRRAVNALRELAGAGPVYAGTDLDEAHLKTLAVDDAHFTTAMAALNSARAAVNLPSVSFVSTPQGGGPIDDTHIRDLRSGVK